LAENIGLFGGTFDPPHLGHLISAQSLAEQLDLARVVFIPSGNPPHKRDQSVSNGQHRVNMLKLAMADNPRFEVSGWELEQNSLTYTIKSVCHFQEAFAGSRLFWLIGLDNLADLPNWYQFEKLIDMVDIATAYRGGLDLEKVLSSVRAKLSGSQFDKLRKNIVRTPMIEIAAHEIRGRVKAGLSIRYLVPPAVEEYIRREGLYR